MDNKNDKNLAEELLDQFMEEPVVLYDENDEEHIFETVAVINLDDGNDIYVLVVPVEENEDFLEDEVLVLMLDEEDNLNSVHDEETLTKVMEKYHELLVEEEQE